MVKLAVHHIHSSIYNCYYMTVTNAISLKTKDQTFKSGFKYVNKSRNRN